MDNKSTTRERSIHEVAQLYQRVDNLETSLYAVRVRYMRMKRALHDVLKESLQCQSEAVKQLDAFDAVLK